MSYPTTTLRAIHAGIESTLRAAFGTRVVHYGPYEPLGPMEPETLLKTPALLIHVESFSQDDDEERQRTRERLATRLAIAVHAVLSLQTPSLQIALRELAADLAVLIRAREHDLTHSARGNRWGLGPAARWPERIEAEPADFVPGLHGRDAWMVRWEQSFYLPNTLSGDD